MPTFYNLAQSDVYPVIHSVPSDKATVESHKVVPIH